MSKESVSTAPAAAAERGGGRSFVPGISKNVLVLGLVSFFTDISSEMIYPLVPIFLTTVLNAPMSLVGVIEGIAEATASVLRAGSGWFSDFMGRRKPLVFAGYGLSSVGKLLMAGAFAWPLVLVARFVDRFGKGVRTPARDALIAESAEVEHRGRAYGFHRALDTLGATVGPLFALLFLWLLSDNMRWVFLIAFVPAFIGVFLVKFAREKQARPKVRKERLRFTLAGTSGVYKYFLAISLLFALGNSSDVFLLLRAKDLGMGLTAVILVYVFYNAVYAVLSTPAGILSDRIGRRTVMTLGFLIFAGVYFGMAFAGSSSHIWALFGVYALYMALTEGIARAFVSDLAPQRIRATAQGTYTMAIGLGALVSSVLAGVLWDTVGVPAPFLLGGATAAFSAILMMALIPRRTRVMA